MASRHERSVSGRGLGLNTRQQGLLLQAEGADALVKTRAFGAEQPRRGRDVPVGLVERLPDPLALGGVANFLQPAARAGPGLAGTPAALPAVIRSPGVRIAIRSTTFRNSRTLPGQA